jgi:hypothetical protein
MGEIDLQEFWDKIENDDINPKVERSFSEPLIYDQKLMDVRSELQWEFCSVYMQNEIYYCEIVRNMNNRLLKCQDDLMGCQREINFVKLNMISLQKERTFWKNQCFIFKRERDNWKEKYFELEQKNAKRKKS